MAPVVDKRHLDMEYWKNADDRFKLALDISYGT
jgi:hypothetical protein